MASYINISELLDSNPYILRLLVNSNSLAEARQKMFTYLNHCEEEILSSDCPLHPLEKKNTRDCINVFKNIISESNEQKTKHSCLNVIWKLATEHWRQKDWLEISDAFLIEMKHLFKGVIGLSGIYSKSGICKREVPIFINMEGREAAIVRSNMLDEKAEQYFSFIKRNGYKTGLGNEVIEKRQENKKIILDLLGGKEEDWTNYHWQLKMCLNKSDIIGKFIELSKEEKSCIDEAVEKGVPFGITPFYLSLMDRKQDIYKYDQALRLHVIPNRAYLDKVLEISLSQKEALDFMHETDTSPIDLVTRRYSMIAILKPHLWCPQICIYCQRNWELTNDSNEDRDNSKNKLEEAISWLGNNTNIREVLITGGDPLIMSDDDIDYILRSFSEMEHIKRIRIATRTLVTMPMRFNTNLMEIIKKNHRPPNKVISFVTHVQHSYEISAEMTEIVTRIKSMGIDIYNQQVFTIQNCRKFETCFLRESLKKIGITPYYLFNLKGKSETSDFKVPIARLLQEQKEESRLMSGIDRTDKPVFNVPTLGKNDLNSWQDHDVIMILNDGSRIYEFYPWEKYMAPVNTFLFKDEPIYNFLKKMEEIGEDPENYKTIWYYF